MVRFRSHRLRRWGIRHNNEGRPLRFRVKLDGTPLGDAHGAETDNNGAAEVQGHGLCQLIRQKGPRTEPLRSNSSTRACRTSPSHLAGELHPRLAGEFLIRKLAAQILGGWDLITRKAWNIIGGTSSAEGLAAFRLLDRDSRLQASVFLILG
jgi:hypothetical protein